MILRTLVAAAAVSAAVAGAVAAGEEDKALTPAQQLAIAKASAAALVRVEYTLQYDKGEAPRAGGWTYQCPNCGGRHSVSTEEPIREERPMEVAGLLVGAGQVLTADPMMHPRFVKDIAVRHGEELVPATVAAYVDGECAVILSLKRPLTKARPAAFDAGAKGPYLAVSHSLLNAAWTTAVKPLSMSVSVTDAGRQFVAVPSGGLIVDHAGTPVGASMNGELPPDGAWKGSPLKWKTVTAEEMARRLKATEVLADAGLLRVALSFRSPPKGRGERYSYSPDDEGATERNVVGVACEKNKVLVLANLKPPVTARLERIVVHLPGGQSVPAKFAHSLADYGCLLAETQTPLPQPLPLSGKDTRDFRNRLVLSAEVILQGEKRVTYFAHSRISSYELGWKRQVYPEARGRSENTFYFDDAGCLLALPVARREKGSGERYSSSHPVLTAAGYLKSVLGDLAANVDHSNVPLSETEENRLAWMGVVLQKLDRELARANGVSDLSRDGEIGALVQYVYPDSPADKAGIKPEMVLLQLEVADQPKPMDVDPGRHMWSSRPFPWQQLDRISVEAFEDAPTPWPGAENDFTRALTNLGFGKKYTAVFFHAGKVLKKDFTVVQSPPHYGTAEKHKSEALGMTVRDMTYEVRRYFRKDPADPGVIVSKVEPGSKADVAKVKPFEIVTHVNDKPVANVKEFQRLITGAAELNLSILRMTQGRLVKIDMKAAAGPATRPSGAGPAAEDD